MFTFSQHAKVRAAQRNMSREEIQYIQEFGSCFHRAGALIYFLRDRDIPKQNQSNQRIQQLCGTALIFSRDNQTLITLWRDDKNGLRNIKQKPAYSTKPIGKAGNYANQIIQAS